IWQRRNAGRRWRKRKSNGPSDRGRPVSRRPSEVAGNFRNPCPQGRLPFARRGGLWTFETPALQLTAQFGCGGTSAGCVVWCFQYASDSQLPRKGRSDETQPEFMEIRDRGDSRRDAAPRRGHGGGTPHFADVEFHV